MLECCVEEVHRWLSRRGTQSAPNNDRHLPNKHEASKASCVHVHVHRGGDRGSCRCRCRPEASAPFAARGHGKSAGVAMVKTRGRKLAATSRWFARAEFTTNNSAVSMAREGSQSAVREP
ncbi:hypothetical protein MPTK1_8g12360 [Marchantia polymorpha subsp. ruderalis]|uniref:Uncharacterized protein n=1 Tax=Marchantia polymorpha TaxID=3197 RepID=A0A2R6WJT8_MARPO|nr:hypothetical protein MARPO_0083s0084 [Marchantia polymorpha]BBN19641.1 hypothetical protein Mp_8g12360 [Marchantia polymorpha subsp. ruderalis]|eukprot:PTQ34126.1 hypothetical protein MARPO_0083s0084 [Marchantia polymorpha]